VQSKTRGAAGIINATGNNCRFSVGTAVSAAYTGPISTKIRVHERYCQALSPDANFEGAVLRPLTYVTVHHSLCTLAQLNSNKTVLIQGGGSILGQAGASLAKALGATVYASIKHHEDRLLLQGMGVSPDHILNDNESYQLTTLMSMTRGHGFDAVLNTSGGEEIISQLWLCMAPGGNFIDASNNGASASVNISIKPFRIGASFNVVNMNEYLASNPSLYEKIFRDSADFFNDRSLELQIELPTFTADRIEEALRSATAPTGPGNAVVLFPENLAVPVSPEVKNQLRLRADATYILAGGLGGLVAALPSL
jgi:NADPH:quinone reductase-like Zn-dependent oxidoreductase